MTETASIPSALFRRLSALRSFKGILVAVAAAGFAFSANQADAAVIIALDNTNGGAASISSGGGNALYEDGTYRKAIIFTTASSSAFQLTDLRLAFQQSSTGTPITLVVELKAVNGSNNPTGATLASLTTSVPVVLASQYYTFDLVNNVGSTFDDYWLSPSTTYALVFSSTGSGGTNGVQWNPITGNVAPVATDGFSFVKYVSTFDSGAAWSTSSLNNSIGISALAVPEPSMAMLIFGGVFLAGFIRRRPRQPFSPPVSMSP